MWKSILFAAVCILGGGFWLWTEISRSLKCTEEADGTITGIESRRVRSRRGSSRKYYPVVEFEAKGETVSGTGDTGSIFKGKYKEGTPVAIWYDPGEPACFLIKRRFLRSGIVGSALLLLFGAAALVMVLK